MGPGPPTLRVVARMTSEFLRHFLAKRPGAKRPAKIAGAQFRYGNHGVERALDPLRRLQQARVVAPLAEPDEEHGAGADQRRWVRLVLPRDVRGGAMLRLRHGVIGA